MNRVKPAPGRGSDVQPDSFPIGQHEFAGKDTAGIAPGKEASAERRQSPASAADGFRLLKELRPDVLISDIEMAGEDGYGLINRVGPEGGGNTHSIALTAYAQPSWQRSS